MHCYQCQRPIQDNDDAGVCILCGGMNFLVVRATKRPALWRRVVRAITNWVRQTS